MKGFSTIFGRFWAPTHIFRVNYAEMALDIGPTKTTGT